MERYKIQNPQPKKSVNYTKKICKKTFRYPVVQKDINFKKMDFSQSPKNTIQISESAKILHPTVVHKRSNSILDKVKQDIHQKVEDASELIDDISPSSLYINLHPQKENSPIIEKYIVEKPMQKVLQIRPIKSPKRNYNCFSEEKIGNFYIKNSSPIYRFCFNQTKSCNNIFLTEQNENINKTYFSKEKSPIYVDQDQIVYSKELKKSEENIQERMSQNKIYDSGSSNENVKVPNLEIENRNIINPRLQTINLEQTDKIHEKYKKKINKNTSYKEVVKLVRRFTNVYDPEKNSNGLLIERKSVVIPGVKDNLFNDRIRVLNKMGKLSNILLSQKNYSPDAKFRDEFEFTNSIKRKQKTSDEKEINNIKVINQRTFEKFREKSIGRKITISRSPKMKFRNIALAMISTKGSNSENKVILRKMRLEKGGVVDLAQESIKKLTKKGIKIRRNMGIRNKCHINPKYKEAAAKIIQFWWKNIKEFYTKKLKYIIRIQSFCRGRFVRKYMYDIIYLNYLYISFCDTIEKIFKNNIKKDVFHTIFDKYKNKIKILKNLILKIDNNDKIKIRKYFNKWLSKTKENNQKKIALLCLLRIRAETRNRVYNIKRILEKWRYISKIKDTKENKGNYKSIDVQELKKQNLRQIKGLFKILDGSKKLIKKHAFAKSTSKIKKYLYNDIIKKQINANQEIKFVLFKKILKVIFNRNKRKRLLEFFEKIGFSDNNNNIKSIKITNEKYIKNRIADKFSKSNKKMNKRENSEIEKISNKDTDSFKEDLKKLEKICFQGEERELSDIYQNDENNKISKKQKQKTTIIKDNKVEKNDISSEENSENNKKIELNNNLNKKTKSKTNKKERKKIENEKMSQEDADSKISASEKRTEKKQTKNYNKDKKLQKSIKNKEINEAKNTNKRRS